MRTVMGSPVVACQACRFWMSTNGQNGNCKRNAPRPTERADEITSWPKTFLNDMCGQGAERSDVAQSILKCEDCAFWSQSIGQDGIYPLDRLGARAEWWRAAGHCKRYSPYPSSSSGQRGFWRVTHSTDSCAEGVPAFVAFE